MLAPISEYEERKDRTLLLILRINHPKFALMPLKTYIQVLLG